MEKHNDEGGGNRLETGWGMGMLKKASLFVREPGVLVDCWCRGRLEDDRRPPAIIRPPRQSAPRRALRPLTSVRPSDT